MKLLTTVLCLNSIVCLQRSVADEDQDKYESARRSAQNIVATVLKEEDQVIELKASDKPILDYSSLEEAWWKKGSFWVWESKQGGRPEAMLSLVTLDGQTRIYEFLSFSTNKLRFSIPNGPTWAPKPNWEPREIADAQPAASSRRLRLIQMKSIAKRFSAYEKDFYADRDKGVRHELRLLPQPVFRYSEESTESLDGACFSLVRSGDLEMLLIIEAEKQQSQTRWVFAAHPVTVHELNLSLDGRVVWSRADRRVAEAKNPEEAYFIFSRPAAPNE